MSEFKTTQTKTLKAEIFTDGKSGSISGHFATFDHDHGDSYGDVIRKGAFLGTIARRKATGHPFPLCYNHNFEMIIGRVTDIGEDETGAYFSADFFPTEKAQEIRNIVKSGVLYQFSFAYDVLDAGKVKAGDGSTVNELREIELYEVSIVTVPANPRATMTDIKTGRALNSELGKQRDEALSYIYMMKEEENAEKSRLLRYIDRMRKDDANERLKKYRDMEAQALKDIGKAEAEGLTEWKQQRLSALKAIQKAIETAEKDLKREGEAYIKTLFK